MNPRRVVILLVVGIVVISLGLYLSSQRHLDRSIETGQTVLPDLRPAVNAVTEVRLTKGDGSKTTLKKRASDWVVVERDYPADSGRVRKLLIDLSDLKVIEEKTREPANYPKLGVEAVTTPSATGTKIEIEGAKQPIALIVGKSAGVKSGYVRVPSAKESLLASPQITVDADPKRWLDRTLLDIPLDHIKEVAVTPATGPAYTITRESKDQSDFTVPNLPKGRSLSSAGAANPVAGSLAGLTLDDVRKPGEAAASKPDGAAQAVFTTFDGLTLDVNGHKDGDRHVVTLAAKSGSKDSAAQAQTLNSRVQGWEFEIPSYKYDAIFRPLEDSLAKVEPAKKDSKSKKK